MCTATQKQIEYFNYLSSIWKGAYKNDNDEDKTISSGVETMKWSISEGKSDIDGLSQVIHLLKVRLKL